MRPQKSSEEDVLSGLSQVFRANGYEGASLTDLATAAGLKKASLYHRFPGGKQAMAKAVFDYLGDRVQQVVFAVLTDANRPPETRLQDGLKSIYAFYDEGSTVCILRAMSMHVGQDLFPQELAGGMGEWIKAFQNLGEALGLSTDKAKEYAIQTLTDIQGSLVVSKTLQDGGVFKGALARIETRYLQA